jgi:hypothetical protein
MRIDPDVVAISEEKPRPAPFGGTAEMGPPPEQSTDNVGIAFG